MRNENTLWSVQIYSVSKFIIILTCYVLIFLLDSRMGIENLYVTPVGVVNVINNGGNFKCNKAIYPSISYDSPIKQ